MRKHMMHLVALSTSIVVLWPHMAPNDGLIEAKELRIVDVGGRPRVVIGLDSGDSESAGVIRMLDGEGQLQVEFRASAQGSHALMAYHNRRVLVEMDGASIRLQMTPDHIEPTSSELPTANDNKEIDKRPGAGARGSAALGITCDSNGASMEIRDSGGHVLWLGQDPAGRFMQDFESPKFGLRIRGKDPDSERAITIR